MLIFSTILAAACLIAVSHTSKAGTTSEIQLPDGPVCYYNQLVENLPATCAESQSFCCKDCIEQSGEPEPIMDNKDDSSAKDDSPPTNLSTFKKLRASLESYSYVKAVKWACGVGIGGTVLYHRETIITWVPDTARVRAQAIVLDFSDAAAGIWKRWML